MGGELGIHHRQLGSGLGATGKWRSHGGAPDLALLLLGDILIGILMLTRAERG